MTLKVYKFGSFGKLQRYPRPKQQYGRKCISGAVDDAGHFSKAGLLAANLIDVNRNLLGVKLAVPESQAKRPDLEDDDKSFGESEFGASKCWRCTVKHWKLTSHYVALVVIFFSIWAIIWSIDRQAANPWSTFMRFCFLITGAQICGRLVSLCRIPDILGMLIFGVFFTNVGWADFSEIEDVEVVLRELAIMNSLLLAGFGLDAGHLKNVWTLLLRLTLFPMFVEVTIIAVMAFFLLIMPWIWCFLLGFIVTACGASVIVTIMLKLKEDSLGLKNGIHTIVYGVAVFTDILALLVYNALVDAIFTTDESVVAVTKGLFGILIGWLFGSLWGVMLIYMPSSDTKYLNALRLILILAGGVIAVLCSKSIGYPTAGSLACVTLAFVASLGWKPPDAKRSVYRISTIYKTTVSDRLGLLWFFLKPVSFSLIGKEINFKVLNGKMLGYGTLIVIVGVVFRLGFGYISILDSKKLNLKEKAFVVLSGVPKASVQASIGPVALSMARGKEKEFIPYALNVLIISVLAIILTAPLAAILLIKLAPYCLTENKQAEDIPDRQPEVPDESEEGY